MPPIQPQEPIDSSVLHKLDDLVRDAGADPDALEGKLVREMMHTAIKLIKDGADTGELKLVSRSLKELRYAMKVFRPFAATRKISIFGSARTPEDHPHYKAAEQFSKTISKQGWMVITGAGDGIMRAGHGGAGREASFGVAIRLPFETTANEFIANDDKLITFRYFFTRKLMFVSQADAVALFPGGFGTQDEGFEVLTLVQTGKAVTVPVVMIDAPGDDYWKRWLHYVEGELLADGMISPEDLSLFKVTDDGDEAMDYILKFYRNYHSQRMVRDRMVFRIQKSLTEQNVEQLNDEFSSLVKEGRIEQSGPLDGETEHLDMPRLHWITHRRNYGKLRQLIDRVNEF